MTGQPLDESFGGTRGGSSGQAMDPRDHPTHEICPRRRSIPARLNPKDLQDIPDRLKPANFDGEARIGTGEPITVEPDRGHSASQGAENVVLPGISDHRYPFRGHVQRGEGVIGLGKIAGLQAIGGAVDIGARNDGASLVQQRGGTSVERGVSFQVGPQALRMSGNVGRSLDQPPSTIL